MSITATDIQALRHAQSVSIHRHKSGQVQLSLHLQRSYTDSNTPPVWSTTEQRLFPELVTERNDWRRAWVNLDGARLQAYDHHNRLVWTAYASLGDTLQTLRALLRKDDEVHVEFIAGNDSPVLEQADVTRDEIWLTIVRKGKVHVRFLAAVTVGKNNSARTILTH